MRTFRPWWEWECFRDGFYETLPPKGMSKDEAKEAYSVFLRDLEWFERGIKRVFEEWPNSCEQFLTNPNINRIAWIGQSAMCIETGVPSFFKSGFAKLSNDEKDAANGLARKYLEIWLKKHELKNI